ncbi:MAG: hypothetical protein K5906_01870 [Bacilli bacterium]|nr:hypothetical protein [Bacilli bacterium]
MDQVGYLILAIAILVTLLLTFIVSFVIYRRTPAPKGCEQIKINEENCSACQNKDCQFHIERNKEEE